MLIKFPTGLIAPRFTPISAHPYHFSPETNISGFSVFFARWIFLPCYCLHCWWSCWDFGLSNLNILGGSWQWWPQSWLQGDGDPFFSWLLLLKHESYCFLIPPQPSWGQTLIFNNLHKGLEYKESMLNLALVSLVSIQGLEQPLGGSIPA